MKIQVLTQPQAFPAGTVAGNFRYTLTSDTGYSNQKDTSATECDFEDATAPGNYSASVERLDADCNVLGSAATGSATIDATPVDADVQVDVPASITVSLV